jgi:isorenieratene synthase
MDRGFHAFFRQYYNLRRFLRRFDPQLSRLLPLTDYPLLGPGGRQESFSGLPKRPPFNLISLVRRTPTLRLKDLVKIPTWPTMEVLSYDRERTYREYDHITAGDFLDSMKFPAEARQMLFDVFAHSFFNPEEEMSAAELIKMFHFYFTGNPEGLIFDVLDQPFSTGLWEPVQHHLEGLGVRFVLGSAVSRVRRTEAGWRVLRQNGRARHDADAVVLATAVPALQRLVAASPDLADPGWRSSVENLNVTLPFAVWRLWFDRPARPERAAFAGTAGLGILDNISVYERFHNESREWATENGGSVIELHAYAVPEGMDEAAIRDDLWTHFVAAYPEFRGAEPVAERFRLDRDCAGFAPGSWAQRPGVETPLSGVALAGDFVRLPIPAALMEAAVTSGILAANHLLSGWGIGGETIHSIPMAGLLSRVAPRLHRKSA